MRSVKRTRARTQPNTRAVTRAVTLMRALAKQIKDKQEKQNDLLREIVLILKEALVQIKSQLIELSKVPTRTWTRTWTRQLNEILVRQRKVEQALKEYEEKLWTTRPKLVRQKAVRSVLADTTIP